MKPTISEMGPALTVKMLLDAEFKLGFTLPGTYVDFLRSSNGGRPSPDIIATPGFPGSLYSCVHFFYGIGYPTECYDLVHNYAIWLVDSPPNLLPIANDPGGSEFVMSVVGGDAGAIYYWDWYREEHPVETPYPWIYPVSKSLEDFLNSFQESLPEEFK